MTIVKIEIDSEKNCSIRSDSHGFFPHLLSRAKIGFLSSIKPTNSNGYQDLIDAFVAGVGTPVNDKELGDGDNYEKDKYKDKRNKLKYTKNCEVIALAGGSVVFEAIRSDGAALNPVFVALVGNVTTLSMNGCAGGISLESSTTNIKRRNYLTNLPASPYVVAGANANIYLLTNSNSEMHLNAGNGNEPGDWGNPGTLIESYTSGANGANDATLFSADFSGAPGKAQKVPEPGAGQAAAVIVSDDPFFQANRAALIGAANAWLDRSTATNSARYVVYPSTMYLSAQDSAGNPVTLRKDKSAIVGPDLKAAYLLLGALTGYIADDKTRSVGFLRFPSVEIPIK